MAGSTPASATVEGAPALGKARSSVSPWAEAWRRFKRHRLAYWSLWVLGLLVLAVLIGPMFYKVGINDVVTTGGATAQQHSCNGYDSKYSFVHHVAVSGG